MENLDEVFSQILNEDLDYNANYNPNEYDVKNLLNSILNENKENIEKKEETENKENAENIQAKENQNKLQQNIFQSFYPSFKNNLDFIHYLEVDRIYAQISKEKKNFLLNNEMKENKTYDISQIISLLKINSILSKFSVNIIIAKHKNLIVNTNDGQFQFF